MHPQPRPWHAGGLVVDRAARQRRQRHARFDGVWSVSIVTEKGSCDRGYRYPIRIAKGSLSNAGNTGFVISGRVNDSGSIMVKVSHGDKSANGAGRLAGKSGGGRWSAGSCSGVWTAERS